MLKIILISFKANVTGIVLAGASGLKSEISKDILGNVLSPLVMAIVDVNYGGRQGFLEAFKLTIQLLSNVKLAMEERKVCEFLERVGKSHPVALGIQEVLHAIDAKALKTLFIYKDIDVYHPTGSHMVDTRLARLRCGSSRCLPRGYRELQGSRI